MEWKVRCETEERCLVLSCRPSHGARKRERQEEEEFGCSLEEIDELSAWWY